MLHTPDEFGGYVVRVSPVFSSRAFQADSFLKSSTRMTLSRVANVNSNTNSNSVLLNAINAAVAKFEPVACHSLLHAAIFTTARQCVALRLHQLMIVASLVPVQLNKGLPVFTGTLRLRSTQSLHTATTPGVTRNRAIGRRPRTVKEHQRTISAALSDDPVTTDNMPEAQSSMLFAAAMPKEEIGALAFLKV